LIFDKLAPNWRVEPQEMWITTLLERSRRSRELVELSAAADATPESR
jgi:hypothetical protein